MPTVHGKYGTVIHLPDDMSDEEMIGLLEQEEKNRFDTVVTPKITAYNDAVDKGKPADEKNRLLADLASVDPERAKTGKKDGGFLGVDNLIRGVGRIGDVASGKADALDAAKDFAGGAEDALGATGRGLSRFAGDLSEDALVNLPVALLSGKSLDEARAQGKEQRSRQWGGDLLGEAIGMGKVAKAIEAVPGAGAGWQAAGSVGLQSAGDHAEKVASGEENPLQAAGIAAQDALLGGAGGKVLEAVTPAIASAIAPAARMTGNAMARVAAPVENLLAPAGRVARDMLGMAKQTDKSQAEKILKSLKLEKDGPLDAATRQRIADRQGVPGPILDSAVDEFERVNGFTPSLIEVADPATMRRYAVMAREREKSMAPVFRDAEEKALNALPGEVASSIEGTGPTNSGVGVLRSLDDTAGRNLDDIANRASDDTAAAARRAEDEINDQKENTARVIDTAKSEGMGTKGETKRASDIEGDITDWGNKAMRDSGLAQQKIELRPQDFKSSIPKDTLIDVLTTRLKAIPEDQRDRIISVVKGLQEGRNSVRISLDDVDVIRRAFNKMADTPGLAELQKSSKALVDKAGDDIPAYKAFLADYAKVSQTAEDMKTIWGDLGNAPDQTVLAARILSPQNRAEIIRVMGPDGRMLVSRIEAGIEGIQRNAAAIRAIEAQQKGATRAVRDSLENEKAQIKAAADKQSDALRKSLAVDKDAVRAAQNIVSKGSDEFRDLVANADKNLPLGDIAVGSLADAARQSPAGAIRTASAMAQDATAERVARVAGQDRADNLQQIGKTRDQSTYNMATVAPRENLSPTGLGAEISGALDAASGLAGRAGPGYKAKMSKEILIWLKKFGMSDKSAIKLANAVARRDASAMQQIIQAATRNPAERATIARGVRSAILGVGGHVRSQ